METTPSQAEWRLQIPGIFPLQEFSISVFCAIKILKSRLPKALNLFQTFRADVFKFQKIKRLGAERHL